MEFDKEQFIQDIYAITRLIPVGRVTSYGAIATALEQKRRVRMVGWAMNNCPKDVPAHRVVNRSGVLTGRASFGGNRMAELLRSEGVTVAGNKVVDFKTIFWSPLDDMDC
ncbi:MGMT family protein [Aureispira anguillae]|uniref:MGMT family protein n=1 Tax=Aureispira anguillae TaxID=2864201 RepID=A0A915YJH8_9BACT|nr:MGMT family protein [Aureispira anguillae]BDS14220.1 MGMT family protein [Aureispira anguillae]